MQLDQLLRIMADKDASDLHLKPMRPPLLRVHGRLMPLEADPMQPEEIDRMVEAILTEPQKEQLEREMAVDLGYGVSGVARFRGNIYRQRGTLAAAFRRVPFEIDKFDTLNLPDVLEELSALPMGLVLVTGPTGSGKSTTLASLVNYISTNRPVHIITIEDPIEFLFTDRLATVSQREVRTDTRSFREALRNAMRQDPDVIMVGEMRDTETISTVISAAETGHLVFSTLHTNSATQTIDRILDSFPANQQKQVRMQLSQVLSAVVSMQLIESADGGGRLPALEILRASPRVCEIIEKGDTSSLREEVESSVAYYRMQSMNQSLLALLVHGKIEYEVAMQQSSDPEDLSLKLRKMFPDIERQGDSMSPSPADFSQILELQQFRRLYEEQEEKTKLRVSDKDSELAATQASLDEHKREIEQLNARLHQSDTELEKLRNEHRRLRTEAQEKINKLGDRIKELNRRLME